MKPLCFWLIEQLTKCNPNPFTLAGIQRGEVENVAEDRGVEYFNADVSIKKSSDDTGDK